MNEIRKIGSKDLGDALDQLAREIINVHGKESHFYLAGIANGGVPVTQALATRLEKLLGAPVQTGVIDISFHRDDFGDKPITRVSHPTELPFSVDGATIILVDDVLFTGRTVRAAINELFDVGRPHKVELAVLFDRGNRALPIRADYLGFSEEIPTDQQVRVSIDPANPSSDSLSIFTA